MALVVQKYGGTSVGSVERIQAVAERVCRARTAGHDVVVVVSAMSGQTNTLVDLAHAVSKEPVGREYDVLLSSGEQISIALVAMAIQSAGRPARSFLGYQADIQTDASFGRARIESIDAFRLRTALDDGAVAVVAGFQGTDADGNITTLGRGGSDTTAVALAAALNADVCEIYTDVDGIYTTDPRIVPEASKISRIAFEEMLELASLGAKVLQTRSVEFAMKHGVPIHVRSSFHEGEGSWVVPEEESMEQVVVRAVAYDKNEARISLLQIPDQPGVAHKVFSPLSDAGIIVDMIIQNDSQRSGHTDLTFTVPTADRVRTQALVEEANALLGGKGIESDAQIAKVSVVGVGMRTHSGIAAKMFAVLSQEGINIQMISTSEIKISVVIAEEQADKAVQALHAAFELDTLG
jgi:aspartate kinase